MWTRRHQTILLVVVALSLFLLLSSSPRVSYQVSRLSGPRFDPSTDSWLSFKQGVFRGGSGPTTSKWLTTHDAADNSILETTTPDGSPAPGFTIFDRLYLYNGTFYVVTSNPDSIPDRELILARPIRNSEGFLHKEEPPTDQELRVISPEDARKIIGDYAVVIEGASFIFYDTKEFTGHYYHYWGEIVLGAMRIYSALSLIPGIPTPLSDPARFLMPNIEGLNWRDHAGVNGPLMRAGFPSSPIELRDSWDDFITNNQTFVFERALIVSRRAAHHSPWSSEWFKMISSTMPVPVPKRFWEPLRQRLVRNMLGYLPELDDWGRLAVGSVPADTCTLCVDHEDDGRERHSTSSIVKWLPPMVTYISRQGAGRRLTDESHEGLIKAMKGLESEGVIRFQTLMMEKLAFRDQIAAVAGSAVLIAVHGNGLTHQLWVPSTPCSTVIEIFHRPAYVHDYEMLSRNAEHKHYAMWNDTPVTYPVGEWYSGVSYGEPGTFHDNFFPVHGPAVAEVVRARLTRA